MLTGEGTCNSDGIEKIGTVFGMKTPNGDNALEKQTLIVIAA